MASEITYTWMNKRKELKCKGEEIPNSESLQGQNFYQIFKLIYSAVMFFIWKLSLFFPVIIL